MNITMDNKYNYSTLVQTHIIFRHGEKIFDQETTFPTDTHFMKTNFFPYKRGELTLEGRRCAYKLGEDLHELYKDFIGEQFYSNIVEARSSDALRTQLTLLCVLAALFPADNQYQIAEGISWQPILYSKINAKEDDTIFVIVKHPELFAGDYMDNLDDDTRKLYDYINLHSGQSEEQGPYLIYRTLLLQEEHKFKLPDWSDAIWPEPLTTAAMEWVDNFWKKKLNVMIEKLISKIISDTKKVYNGTGLDDTKMYIYAAHDLNIAALLQLVQNPLSFEEINYLSCFIFEVHLINGVFGIKILYKDGDENEFKYLKIPNYDDFISLEDFEKFVSNRLNITS